MPMSPVNPGGAGAGSVADSLLGLITPEIPAAVAGDATRARVGAFAQVLGSLLNVVRKPAEHIDLETISPIDAGVSVGGESVVVDAAPDITMLFGTAVTPADYGDDHPGHTGRDPLAAVAVPAGASVGGLLLAVPPAMHTATVAFAAGKELPAADNALPPAGSMVAVGDAAVDQRPVSAQAAFAAGLAGPATTGTAPPPVVPTAAMTASPPVVSSLAPQVSIEAEATEAVVAKGADVPRQAADPARVVSADADGLLTATRSPAAPAATADAPVPEGMPASRSMRAVAAASMTDAGVRVPFDEGGAPPVVGDTARQSRATWSPAHASSLETPAGIRGMPLPSDAEPAAREAGMQGPPSMPAAGGRSRTMTALPAAVGAGAWSVAEPRRSATAAPVPALDRAAGAEAAPATLPPARSDLAAPVALAVRTEDVAPSVRAASADPATDPSAVPGRAGRAQRVTEAVRVAVPVETAGTGTSPGVTPTPAGGMASVGEFARASAPLRVDTPLPVSAASGVEPPAPGAQSAAGVHPLAPVAPALPATDASARAPFAPLAFAEAAQWAGELDARVRWFVGRGIGTAEIRLDPPELGPLQVTVHTQREGASVHFSAASAPVRDLLEHSLPRLRELLENGGMNLVDVNVSQQRHGGGYREAPSDPGFGLVAAADSGSGVTVRDAAPRATRGIIDAYV